MISDWGEVVTRYPYGNVRMDHLLSKEMETCTLVLFSFERSCGALAQLGERLLCTQEVSGSIPLGSIESKDSSIVH